MRIKAMLHVRRNYENDLIYSVYESSMSEYGYVCLGDITINITKKEITQQEYSVLKIKQLEESKKKIQAKAYQEVQKVEEEIQKLLCIEHKPEEVEL